MTQKQVPGADPVYMVYDNRNRLVATQDGNQRSGSTKYWTFTKYDRLNRSVLTGLYASTNSLAQMQSAVDSYYANLTGSQAWYESYVGSISGNAHGYDNASFPQTAIAGYLTVTYYDNYEFLSAWIGTFDYVDDGLSQTVNGVVYSQPMTEHPVVTGQVTGTKVGVLDGGVAGGYTWLKSVSYYDDHQRVIQVTSENYKGGADRISNLYDFAGRVLNTRTTHTERDVIWKDKVNVTAKGNKLTHTGPSDGWGTAGAASVQQLGSGVDGWMEFVASETNPYRMIGLSNQNTDASYASIDYAWYVAVSGILQVVESGTTELYIGNYAPGDVLKIERVGTTIKYYQNNVLRYTSSTSSSSQLLVDVAFYSVGATLTNVRSSFSTSTNVIDRRYVYDHAGRLIETWHQVDGQPEVLLASNEYNALGQLIDKKLHSTTSGASDARQSIDYRYNIRGWLTKINESDLDINESGDPRDYFGMQLGYNDDLGTGNNANPQYNGNISGVKWSTNLGLSDTSELAYNYAYDDLNRISAATYREKNTSSWSTPTGSSFSVSNYTYDLNGNILGFTRKGSNGDNIDILTYDYGSGTMASNKLLSVSDSGDDAAGFIDGGNTGDDYRYDENGNLINDLNKEIGTSISDNTNRIFYNYLNLPETVQKSTTKYIEYVYDATGRKLHQHLVDGTNEKWSDYAGEFFYENDTLKFVQNEEGRVLPPDQVKLENLITNWDANSTQGFPVNQNVTITSQTSNGQSYVKVVSNQSGNTPGTWPIGNTFNVQEGEKYIFKVKGYRTTSTTANLYVWTNVGNLVWPGEPLPPGSGNESWTSASFTIPAGATSMKLGVLWNIASIGDTFYINEVGLYKEEYEYQYHMNDHLANVRLTFTTKEEEETYTATFEDNTQVKEQNTFQSYSRVTADLYDHTDAGTVYDKVQLLNGGYNSQVGLTKTLAVMPGDTVTGEVYAKYYETTGGSGNLTGFAAALLSAFGLPTPGGGEVGTASAAIQSYGAFIAGGGNTGNSSWPKGWLNMLVFDKDYNLVDLAYEQLDASYVQPVGNGTKLPMQLLSISLPIKEPGYVYIYISNEGSTQQDIYFDDMTITHTKSPIIQADDYYPFGLTFNSYRRENSVQNDNKFNGIEEQDEIGLGVYHAFYRTLDPTIGRWWQNDPKAEEYYSWSPFNAMGNNPITVADPLGDEWLTAKDKEEAKKLEAKLDKGINKLEAKNAKLASQVKKATAKGKTNRVTNLQTKIANNKDRIGEMNASIGDLNYMSDPKTTLFTFEMVSGTGETRIDRRDVNGVKRPVIVIGHLGRDASKVHEVRHGAEIATHKIRTVLGLIDGNDEEKAEVSAYRAQYSFDPSSMPSSKGGTPMQVSQVNGYYVGGIMNSDGKPVYQRTNKKYTYK